MAYNIHQQLEMILHKQASLSWYILLLSPKLHLPFGPQFSLKIRGGGGERGPQHSESKHFDLDLSKQLISKRVCQWSFLAN